MLLFLSFSLLHKVSHHSHILSYTFAHCLLLMLPYMQTYTSSPSRAHVLCHIFPGCAYTFIWRCALALICNFKLLLLDTCKYEPMFGKDVFLLRIVCLLPQKCIYILLDFFPWICALEFSKETFSAATLVEECKFCKLELLVQEVRNWQML